MATLEERLQNLTQEVNPIGSGVMSDQDVERVMGATNPPPRRLSATEIMEMRKTNPMAGMLGSPSGMYQDDVSVNPMQPLVDLGFGDQVNIILSNPADSQISRDAQQVIINELGTGMDIDGFLMEVRKLAPEGAMSNQDMQGIMSMMGRNEDTTIGHLAEGDVVVPPEVLQANPPIADALDETMMQMGVDPRSRIVDTTGELGGIASINPDTGLQEFFLKKALSKLNRARKKITKKLAPVVGAVAPFIPGIGPLAKAGITALSGKASGLSTKDALLGGALSYGGSKLFAGNPLNPAKGTVPKGNIFSRIGEYVMPGKDGVGLLGNLRGTAGNVYEYIMPGKDNVGLYGNVKSGISGLFNRTPESDIIKYDPVNQGYINIETGMPATASEIASLSQSNLGRIEDVAKMLTGDDGMTRTEELMAAGYTPEQIEQAKANGTFNALVSQARAEGKVPGRGVVGAIQGALTGGTQAGGGQGGMGMGGKFALAGLAGLLGKLAYEEQKKQKGVPLTPLTTMDALGRYNIASEIARRTGEEMPSRVEFGLTAEGMPALSGGMPRNARYGGIMAFAQGGAVAMQEGGEPPINMADFPRKNGEIDGPGTGTSDDIPAMLSDGEFVMTAKAVRNAGSYDMSAENGIVTLSPNGGSDREAGTRIMYKLMNHFENLA
jgi:hypothetical protein